VRARLVSRARELDAITTFLDAIGTEPAGLIFDGEPGVGKTTLWLATSDEARRRGMFVMSARAAAGESVMAYASLADLLSGVDADALAGLPEPQRLGLERALLRREAAPGNPTDQRTVAAGLLSVVGRLAEQIPVVIAIDDLQWLDPSTQRAVMFAARRLRGRVGIVATVRAGAVEGMPGLQLPRPDMTVRKEIRSFDRRDLQAVISERLGRTFNRPIFDKIYALSDGNPFYAIELAHAMTDDTVPTDVGLPDSLAGVVRARLTGLDEAEDALLATACLAVRTVELVARAIDVDNDELARLLADAEQRGIIEIKGNGIRFTHPILSHAVYSASNPTSRRAMHRRLAAAIEEPEVHARHLALAATSADAATIEALDAAATSARSRGAPAAAAELLDLAIALGDDRPERQIASAGCHLDASNSDRARALLEPAIGRLSPGPLRAQAITLLAVVRMYADSFAESAVLLQRAVDDTVGDPALAVHVLVMLSYALISTRGTEATATVDEAVAKASALGPSPLLSQALSMRAMIAFMSGRGLDTASMQRALDLEDDAVPMPLALRPSAQHALLMSWTGELEKARHALASIRRRCDERGEESELTFVAFTSVLLEVWRGDFAEAARGADEALELAHKLDSDFPLFMGLTLQSVVAAYTGDADRARADGARAVVVGQRCGSTRLAELPVMAIGFLEVSLGQYETALTTLAPLVALLEAVPDDTEIATAWFVPEAAEAMIGLGRLDEAEALIDVIEANGRRLDRAWMLAVGARSRAMLVAARGDVRSALEIVEVAMQHHDRLPMPFERARTQLVKGVLQRRHRQRDAASTTLSNALSEFERLGTPLWATRARAELARAKFGANKVSVLTTGEQRIAELAASGMTNRDVAAALFISPKTVESNLSSVYRKLGIHSRAELGRHMARERDGKG
jgi:ATP/maltotriose-dependent transcriptional regulator MalT